MKLLTLICLATIFSLGMHMTAGPAWAQSELNGAWKIIEASGHNDNGDWKNTNPQPSLYIFYEGYYSEMFVPGEDKRPLYEEGESSATIPAEKLLAIYQSFVANSGTYEISGSTITARPMVAKHPNLMNGGSWTATFRLENDRLYLSGESPSGRFNDTLQRLK